AAGEICETGGALEPRCANVDWARSPMPDSTSDTHTPKYLDNGDGTVTDGVTGLMWQRTVPLAGGENEGYFTADEASKYCSETLSDSALGGHHDWRLPSRIELLSLVDYNIATPGPTIDTGAFPNTPAEQYWTRIAQLGPWFVDFSSGYSKASAADET